MNLPWFLTCLLLTFALISLLYLRSEERRQWKKDVEAYRAELRRLRVSRLGPQAPPPAQRKSIEDIEFEHQLAREAQDKRAAATFALLEQAGDLPWGTDAFWQRVDYENHRAELAMRRKENGG
jgi:hypothetical protein